MPKVRFGDQTINFVEKGIGEPVILLHGVGLDHTMWKQQIDYLSMNHRVIAYDMLCHGESEKTSEHYELIHFVDQLLMLLDGLTITKAHLIGFSMGGMVAQLFGVLHPDRVQSLCFMSAVANRTKAQQEAVLNRVKQVEQEGHLVTIDEAISRWFNEHYMKSNPEIIQSIKNKLKENDPLAYLKAYTVFANADQELWGKLEQINQPTLIMTGEADVGSSPVMATQMHERIKGSELVIIPSIRHMLPIEGADIVNQVLDSFIKKHCSHL
ncbi:alpha/beta fold hydrolase [Alkalihalobacillus deserti]|uniref:alpha/beta fold hydrolase n=1 Tax=Alkalihalobacillus deserti TaxID=2879466 RepID=UPI001D13F68F|nr:alpha/beta hydrolase [Alkalihalobacillus deserti]